MVHHRANVPPRRMQPATAATLPLIPSEGDRPVSNGASTDKSAIERPLQQPCDCRAKGAFECKPLPHRKFQIGYGECDFVSATEAIQASTAINDPAPCACRPHCICMISSIG